MNRLILPLPPSQNHMYRNYTDRSGRRMRVIMHEGTEWMKQAQQEAEIWKRQNGWELIQRKKIVMRLWFYWPDGRNRDTHNRLKLLLDSLEKVLYQNDSYVLPRIMDFEVDRKHPRVELEMEVV